jgi:transposase
LTNWFKIIKRIMADPPANKAWAVKQRVADALKARFETQASEEIEAIESPFADLLSSAIDLVDWGEVGEHLIMKVKGGA